jgi:outer membrane lipoprotein-sorting protein
MNEHEPTSEEILDSAARALLETRVPEGPPRPVVDAVLEAGSAAGFDALEASRERQRRRVMTRIAKIAAVILVAAGVAVTAFLMFERSPHVAFAQVREMIKQVRTMTCRMHITYPANGEQMGISMQAYYKLPHFMRQELRVQGVESPMVNIYDFKEGKMLNLLESEKAATIINLGQLPEELLKKQHQNMAEELKKLIQGDSRPLGEKVIGGTDAVGFHVTEEGVAMDVWVDAETGEQLLLLEADLPGQGHIVMTDVVLNGRLDDALFSLDIPEGYRRMPSVNIPLDNVTEEDLVEGLRLLAEHNGNKFPAGPNITPEIVKNMSKSFTTPPGLSKEEREKRELEMGAAVGARIARLAMFAQINAGTFKYVGEGVMLGDKARPVCWYKPKDSDVYRIVYGHLGVANVGQEDLPKIEPQAPPSQAPAP